MKRIGEFTGFSQKAIDFLQDLANNNNKAVPLWKGNEL